MPPSAGRERKNTIGYALNLVEVRDEKKNLGLILHHEQQQNSISDVEFGNNTLDAAIASKIDAIANDGGYFSSSNVGKANGRGVDFLSLSRQERDWK